MPTTDVQGARPVDGVQVFTWPNVPQGNDCAPISPRRLFGDATLVVSGTLDGATVRLLGSHDGVVKVPVRDTAGAEIALTGADFDGTTNAAYAAIGDVFPFMEPEIAGGRPARPDRVGRSPAWSRAA